MRILLDGLSNAPHVSVGSQAMILGAMNIIERRFPGTRFLFISSNPAVESWYLKQGAFNVDIQKRETGQFRLARQMLATARSADAVVTVWGDAFVTAAPHTLYRKAFIYRLSRKPLVMFTASIGPFAPGWRTWLTRRGLLCFDALSLREPNTLRFVESLGVKDGRVYPDTAYGWPAADPERAKAILRRENVPLEGGIVGVNISMLLHHIYRHQNTETSYEEAMCRLIDHLRALTRKHLILLPHQIYCPGYDAPQGLLESRDGDDRIACQWVYDRLQDKTGVSLIRGDYTAAEYKAIMRQCEIFLGGRMHSVVGAVSTGTPSLVMQYSHKAEGVMNMLGMSEYVWDIRSGIEACKQKVNRLWDNRREVRESLARQMALHIEGAFALGAVLDEVIRAGRNRP